MADISRLFGEVDVRGQASDGLDEAFAERLGRGLGTLARQRGIERTAFVVGREAGERTASLRDGLVRGLLQSGHGVIDIGATDARRHEFAMIHLARPAGVLVVGAEDGGAAGFEVLMSGGPLVGETLRELREVVLQGDFCAGEGALELVDIGDAFRDAEREGEVPGFGHDTQVV